VRVRFLTGIAAKSYSYSAGQVAELPKEQAIAFVRAGIAESLDVETATAPPAKETTSTRKGRKKNANNTGNSEKAT